MQKHFFKYKNGKLPLPLFFPDATRAVIRTLDTTDIENTKTQGILVNTYHLYKELGFDKIQKSGGIRKFMNFDGAVISDSGGFQVGSLIKRNPLMGKVTDGGVLFKLDNTKIMLSPEKSIEFQLSLGTDMVVVLDDFSDPNANYKECKLSVERTIDWAKRSKKEFDRLAKRNKPYILGVVQGGEFMDLRRYCAEELVKIGFDGLGWGGWPFVDGRLNFESAKVIAENAPKDYFLYGLGIGKPEDIIQCVKLGFNIFDCVLPTRDARHGRLYVYNSKSIDTININGANFYSYYNPAKQSNLKDLSPVSMACDCLLCSRYSKSYLAHLFSIGDFTAGRLATIHNLRFYSILMEKIRLLLKYQKY